MEANGHATACGLRELPEIELNAEDTAARLLRSTDKMQTERTVERIGGVVEERRVVFPCSDKGLLRVYVP